MRSVSLGAAALLSALLPTPLLAARSVVWTEDLAGLSQGLTEEVAFTSSGGIVLAPRAEELGLTHTAKSKSVEGKRDEEAISEAIVWCEALDAAGNLILGTGHSGRLVQITPRGEVSTLAELSEPEVTALLVAKSGGVFAATSPNGAIYRIVKGKDPAIFFEPDERYIWSLAEDRDGYLYAGTGEKGRIYRVSPKGEGKVFYDAPEPHITALLFDRSDVLLAGSVGSGAIYRIDPKQNASVLYDSNYREITRLALDGAGNLYAAAISAGAGEIPPPVPRLRVSPSEEETPVPSSGEEIPPSLRKEPGARTRERPSLEAEVEGLSIGGAGALRTTEGGGAIFRISPAGVVDELWRSSQEVPYSLVSTTEGTLYAGLGEPARLVRLEESGRPIVLNRFPQAQITDLLSDRSGRLFVATSNSGAAYRVARELSEAGLYQSPPRDAGVAARWGRVQWEAAIGSGQKIEISTRSGNAAIPDETWSTWSPPYADPSGSEIASPQARYIQWRARLSRSAQSVSSPLLRSVSVSYQPRNRAPRVREARLLSRADTPGEKARTIVWHAEDPDDDRLAFRVFLQREGEEKWSLLSATVAESPCTFDDGAWPEGRYRVKVVASDAPSNYPGEALESESITDLSVIDHTPPSLKIVGPGDPQTPIRVEAADLLSPISSAEILCGDTILGLARPTDGVLDSKTELLVVDPTASSECVAEKGAGAQEPRFHLRVRDAGGNEADLDLPRVPARPRS